MSEDQLLIAASLLAADLAGSRVDPNEAQKALAFLRSAKEPRDYFAYLQAIVKDGRVVIRSAQTLEYYRNLLAASERHLRGLSVEDMRTTLGWAIRLLRYYRAVPDAELLRLQATSPTTHSQEIGTAQPIAEPSQAPPVRAAPKIPEVGEVFGGEVLQVSPQGIVLQVKQLDPAVAVARIRSENLAGKQYGEGATARVEVIAVSTTASGRIVLDCKPAPKPKK